MSTPQGYAGYSGAKRRERSSCLLQAKFFQQRGMDTTLVPIFGPLRSDFRTETKRQTHAQSQATATARQKIVDVERACEAWLKGLLFWKRYRLCAECAQKKNYAPFVKRHLLSIDVII